MGGQRFCPAWFTPFLVWSGSGPETVRRLVKTAKKTYHIPLSSERADEAPGGKDEIDNEPGGENHDVAFDDIDDSFPRIIFVYRIRAGEDVEECCNHKGEQGGGGGDAEKEKNKVVGDEGEVAERARVSLVIRSIGVVSLSTAGDDSCAGAGSA